MMRWQPTTCVRGIVVEIDGKLAHLQLEAAAEAALGRRFIWVPIRMIDGGNTIKVGSTDPLISDWWLRERKYAALLTLPRKPSHTTGQHQQGE